MTILIDNRSGLPIYEQIASQLRQQILRGDIPPDEPLPSIRNLARDLRVSVITTKRAYEELEAAGLIYTLPGKGSFAAAAKSELQREEHLRCIEEHMSEILRLAASGGVSREELAEMWKLLEEDT
jgi:GntR family transcriptional regulator